MMSHYSIHVMCIACSTGQIKDNECSQFQGISHAG